MPGTPKWIESIYEIKLRALREAAQTEFSALLGEMRSADRPGADLSLLGRKGGKLADDAVARCEAAIPELAEAHVKAGDHDVGVIVETIQTKLVDALLNGLPGAALYVSVRGGAPAVAAGMQLRQGEDARFQGRRASLRSAVLHHVVRALGQSQPAATSTFSPDQDLRRVASVALAQLYVETINHSVPGKALRHRLKTHVNELDGRRALTMSLVPELASRSGVDDDDYFRPTLLGLLEGLPLVATIIDATLDMLRAKYDSEGDVHSYTWEELEAFFNSKFLQVPFSREGAIQILSVAELNAGWNGVHWAAPRNLEALLEIPDAHSLARRSQTQASATSQPTSDPAASGTIGPLGRFDVALSFPGDVRQRVEPVATLLAQALGRSHVFYDRFYTSSLARPNLDTFLQDIYRNRTELLVVFIGQSYQDREWCGIEWRAIRDIMKSRQDERVMLVRTDGASVDGILSIDGYVDLRETTDAELVTLVLERLSSLRS
jgi:hypothetical protein